jgi:hypothetical protein
MSFLGTSNLRRSKILNLRSYKVANVRRSRILNLRSSEVVNVRRSRILNLRSSEVVNVRWSGISNLRSFEVANSWRPEVMNLQNHENESVKFENLLKVKFGSHGARRFPERGDSRTSKKQSQRRRLKKSGFGVWTSGRLVNVWDVKDIHVHVHTRNILCVRGCFRNVKVPLSPYKRGREGTCKRIHNFWGLSSL